MKPAPPGRFDRGALRWLRRAAVAALLASGPASGPAAAADRPFLATSSAAAEEDDDAVWSVESGVTSLGRARAIGIQLDYAFDPTTSLQLELASEQSQPGSARASTAGLELRHLFNRIARDGWGWGLMAAVEGRQAPAASWQCSAWSLTLPLSLQLGITGALLHLNVGASWPRDEARQWTRSLALQHQVFKRTVLFAEIARGGDGTLLHGGLRHWLQRDKLALDVSLQRRRGGGLSERGAVIGLGWYDL